MDRWKLDPRLWTEVFVYDCLPATWAFIVRPVIMHTVFKDRGSRGRIHVGFYLDG